MSIKRLAIYLFYDKDGIVDDYIPYKLNALKEFVSDIYFVSNSDLSCESRTKIENLVSHIICRENVGFDVWGYKSAIEFIGYDTLNKYDELILLNYTFFAPIFPFSELFSWSEEQTVDFWGISDYKEIIPNPFTGTGILHRHIQSHFIAIRKKLFSSYEFKEYWDSMPMINSYIESILKHESVFTHHFYQKGYSYSVYVNTEDYNTNCPIFFEIKDTIKNRSPILKRRPFFHEPLYHDKEAIFLRRDLEYLEKNTEYDLSLIISNIVRVAKPKDLFSNLSLIKVFDSYGNFELRNNLKVLVVVHLYYPEMLIDIFEYIENIPCHYDVLITTNSDKNKNIIIHELNSRKYLSDSTTIEVLVVEQNRGRDMSSLFITCKDRILNGEYDFICRLHSKKSPQNSYSTAQHFKDMMYDNLLQNRNYVSKLLHFMDSHPYVGLMCPPMVHIGYPTLGHAWFTNKGLAYEVAKKLKINVPFDDISPFAAYGTMFWFRPKALKKLFEYEWKFEDFNPEPNHTDGGLAHVLERLIVYAVHDMGYLAYNVFTSDMAEINYSKLEYKINRLALNYPNGDLVYWAMNPISIGYNSNINNSYQKTSFLIKMIRLLKAHVIENYPKIRESQKIRRIYVLIRSVYHKIRRG